MTTTHPPIVRVDSQGNPIGPVWYKEAHPQKTNVKGIPHAVSIALIFEDPNFEQVLTSLRGTNVDGGGRWDYSAGGHADWIIKEARPSTPTETANKEVSEELFNNNGLPQSLRLEQISTFWIKERQNNQEYVHLFRGVHAGPYDINPEEVAAIRFNLLPDLLDQVRADTDKQTYTRTLERCLSEYLSL